MLKKRFRSATWCVFLFVRIASGAGDPATPLADVQVAGSIRSLSSANTIELGHSIRVPVEGLRKLYDTAMASNKSIVLYLNGMEMTNVFAEQVSINPSGSGFVDFHLERTPENKKAWAPIFRRPFVKNTAKRSVDVNLGLSGGLMVSRKDRPVSFNLTIRGTAWQNAAAGLLIVLLAVLAVLGGQSAILRDSGAGPSQDRPFSLARLQLMIWFMIIFGSFFMIWIITGDADTLTGSSLVLLGISAGTYFGAGVKQNIDSRKTTGFWSDILSDEGGLSLHRFQMLAWTVVLGIIFLVRVGNELGMPELSGELLALMGISSATYVTAKAALVGGVMPVMGGQPMTAQPAAGGGPPAGVSNAPLAQPTKVNIASILPGTVIVSCGEIEGATSYELNLVQNGESRTLPFPRPAVFRLTNLPRGAKISISISGVNAAGKGPASPPKDVTVL